MRFCLQELIMQDIKIHFGENIEADVYQEKTIEDIFQSVNPMFCFSKNTWKPQMDIFETKSQIIIQAAVSGVKEEDIIIELSNKAAKIKGSRCCRHPDRTATYRLAEIQFGEFERVLYLPADIDPEKSKATFSNGFLELRMNKISRKRNQSRHSVPTSVI